MSERFAIALTPIAGVVILDRRPRIDARGWLDRLFDAAELEALLPNRPAAQVNRSLTHARGTVRGLHVQAPPAPEAKLVTCLRGAVFDVAVDLRHASPTFLQWHGVMLAGTDRRSLLIPEGVAHGFQVLEEDSELLYVHTGAYDAGAERGVDPRDPAIGVAWPLPMTGLSERDASHPPIDADFMGIKL